METFSNKTYDESNDIDLMVSRNFNGIELSGGERVDSYFI